MSSQFLGLDVGGANLKIAGTCGKARSIPFPLWRMPDQLESALCELLSGFDDQTPVAATMTGELADCFETKQAGVDHIVASIEAACKDRLVQYYLTNGELVDAETAKDRWQLAAASNWHALSTFVSKVFQESHLLVDLGSTTCDIIPLTESGPRRDCLTDLDRMKAGELIYTGVDRSPLCAIVPAITIECSQIVLAQELFATMGDVYLVLGTTQPEDSSRHTADGGPRTVAAAKRRIARMLCADVDEVGTEWIEEVSQRAAATQESMIAEAIKQLTTRLRQRPTHVVISGQGERMLGDWLPKILPGATLHSLSDTLSEATSQCAPAFAVANLAMTKHGLGVKSQ